MNDVNTIRSVDGPRCFACRKKIRKEYLADSDDPSKVFKMFEITINLFANDKVGNLYFHPHCFSNIAGKKYYSALEKTLR